MACPLCGDRCTCSFAPTMRVGASAPSSLTYDYDDEYRPDEHAVEAQPPKTTSTYPSESFLAAAAATPAPPKTSVYPSETFLAAAVSPAGAAPDPVLDAAPAAPPEDLDFEKESPPEEESGPLWKQEVTSRLESYRARRGSRRPRYNATMSLDFDRAANRIITSAVHEEAAWEQRPSTGPVPAPETAPSESPANEFFGATGEIPAPDSWAPVTKILEFPRLPTLFDNAPTGNELAESVVDKPRILYVPEEVPTAQAPLADIQIDPEERPEVPEVELPLRVAPMGNRVLASLTDALIVLAGATIFMAVALREVPAPDSKVGYLLVAALPVVFWAIYQYLFLVHCAATPGMQMANLSLASFDSEPIGRRLRRARALAWMLSTFPLGLGLIWALLDEDTLCWHDRITRTYLTVPFAENDR